MLTEFRLNTLSAIFATTTGASMCKIIWANLKNLKKQDIFSHFVAKIFQRPSWQLLCKSWLFWILAFRKNAINLVTCAAAQIVDKYLHTSEEETKATLAGVASALSSI